MVDPAVSPSAITDELLFKDLDGQFKVLRGGQVVPWSGLPAAAPTVGRSDSDSTDRTAAAARLLTLVDQVVAELKLSSSDPELQKRLRQVVLSRFKDVRDQIETRETLLKSVAEGGLGFDAPLADRVSRLIERHYLGFAEGARQAQDLERREFEANVGPLPPPSLVASSHAADRLLAKPVALTPLPPRVAPKVPPLPKPLPRSREQGTGSMGRPVVTPTPSIHRMSNDELQITQPTTAASTPVVQRQSPSLPPVIPRVVAPPMPPTPPAPPVTVAERPRPKLVGPLEELQELTLTDFRQLGSDPVKACQRIREKILLLEQQSFGHKAAAIAAWRKSPLFRLYTQLATRAMGGKHSIADAIAKSQADGQDSLRVEEFEVIADLNRSLRF